MNAYELAQYLEVAFYSDEDIEKATTMLRQQADRIAELEKALSRALDLLEGSKGEVNG